MTRLTMGVRDILQLVSDGGDVRSKSADVHTECRNCGSNLAVEASKCPECGGGVAVYEL
jgi:hypothetical protein